MTNVTSTRAKTRKVAKAPEVLEDSDLKPKTPRAQYVLSDDELESNHTPGELVAALLRKTLDVHAYGIHHVQSYYRQDYDMTRDDEEDSGKAVQNELDRRTIHFGVGRQLGNSAAISQVATFEDIIVVSNFEQMRNMRYGIVLNRGIDPQVVTYELLLKHPDIVRISSCLVNVFMDEARLNTAQVFAVKQLFRKYTNVRFVEVG